MNVFVLNCGSSTVKFQAITIQSNQSRRLARGSIERLGEAANVMLQIGGQPAQKSVASLRDIQSAVKYVLGHVKGIANLHAVGHRVVHGGERFIESVVLTEEVIGHIESLVDLAPLHNHSNLVGIRAAREVMSDIPHVAVFDTAFHQTLPEVAFLYAVPYEYYQRHSVRRYGFHGTSHRYVADRYRQLLNLDRERTNIITLHLGNGSSVCAIKAGVSIDTSMGLTPLEGLVMGTRSGDIDPAIFSFLMKKEELSPLEVESMLNHESGLLGLSGRTNDMRELLEEAKEDRRSSLAIEIFCYRARKYIGAYLAAMGGADAIVFTGGIGENAPQIRERICEGLEWIGLTLDPALNRILKSEGPIHREGSKLGVYVIPTDEELLIARDTVRCVDSQSL